MIDDDAQDVVMELGWRDGRRGDCERIKIGRGAK